MASTVVTGGNADLVIKATLDCLTHDMLSSIRSHNPAVSAISSALSKVDSLVHSCHESLNTQTKDLLSSFASIMAFLPAGLQQAETETDELINQFSAETTALLQDKLSHRSSKRSVGNKNVNMEPAARWLRDNWFNPYPSDSVRANMTVRTRSTRKDIDTWFADSRKRIGWNNLRKKHFNTKKALIETATHFNSPQSSLRGVDVCGPVAQLLAAVKAEADALYEKFTPSRLAQSLDTALTPNAQEQRQSRAIGFQSSHTNTRSRGRVYPTPSKSPLRQTCSPSPSDDGSLCRSVSPQSDVSESTLNHSMYNTLDVASTTDVSLPTPMATPTRPDFESLHTATSSGGIENHPVVGKKRKRCLSEGFQHPAAKVPRVQQQTVSDQYPFSVANGTSSHPGEDFLSAFDWYTTNPSSLLGQELDSSVPLIIETANLAIPSTFGALEGNRFTALDDLAPEIQPHRGTVSAVAPALNDQATSSPSGIDIDFDAWAAFNMPDCLLTDPSGSVPYNPTLPFNVEPASNLTAPSVLGGFTLDMPAFMWHVPMNTAPSAQVDVTHCLPASVAPLPAAASPTQSREERILQLEAELRMLKGSSVSL